MRWVPLIGIALLAACSLPRWPVDAPMTSPFGLRLAGLMPQIHRGVDIDGAAGEPVRAMAAGRVTFAGRMRGYGLMVVIDHGRGVETRYAHLARVEVDEDADVDGRDIIGRVGSTGNAQGAHLHFEVWTHGRPADPVPLLGRPPGR